jgi:hypothetical protein
MSRQIRRAIALSTVIAPVAIATPLLATGAQATGAAPHCRFAQLAVREGRSDSGAGHIMFPIHFRNTSHATCTLYGYPGAAGLNRKGAQVVQATRVKYGYSGGVKAGNPIPLVTLQPGQQGTARIEGSDVPGPNGRPCRELHGLLVTPPNDQRSAHLNDSPPSCRLQIHPVIKGSSGTQGP